MNFDADQIQTPLGKTMTEEHKKRNRSNGKALVIFLVIALVASLCVYSTRLAILARDAYLFAHPLVIMEVTGSLSEKGVLIKKRDFPDASFRRVVRPNVDTLYTSGFFNANDGPWVFQMAENAKRYEVMQFMDGWTNVFASIGTRTHGTGGGSYFIVGPDWDGEIPEGLEIIRSPTDIVWMIGRTQTNGPQDLPLVHSLQDGLTLRTYADWKVGKPEQQPTISTSTRESTAKIVRELSAREYFQKFAKLLETNPPSSADEPMITRLSSLGIHAGAEIDWNVVEHLGVRVGRWLAHSMVKNRLEEERKATKGWIVPDPILGDYGTDYQFRAVVSMVGLGANKREDAVYLQGKSDSNGEILEGSKRYRIHFAKGQTPPVSAFWSVTAYGADHYLIDNPINRYSLGDRDPLEENPDGSLDIWIQADPPAEDKISNWLPVKRGEPFLMSTRLYWPKEAVLSGEWTMPAIELQE